MRMMRDVYIIGAGMTQFGKHLERSLRDLGREACLLAIQDAGVTPKEVEAGYCGNALAPAIQGETGVGQNVFWEVGISGIPIVNMENACASGSTALREGWMAVAGGFYDVVMVAGVEKAVMPKGTMLQCRSRRARDQTGRGLSRVFRHDCPETYGAVRHDT